MEIEESKGDLLMWWYGKTLAIEGWMSDWLVTEKKLRRNKRIKERFTNMVAWILCSSRRMNEWLIGDRKTNSVEIKESKTDL